VAVPELVTPERRRYAVAAASAADAGLKRYLARLRALITIEELREVSGLVGVDPDHDPSLPPWLFG
jgi:hypothetical protein